MPIFQSIDINIFAFVVLSLIFLDARNRTERPSSTPYLLFMHLVYVLSALLVTDSLGRVFDGYPGRLYLLLNWFSNMLLYILAPTAPALWVLYVIRQVHLGAGRLKKPVAALAPLLAANALITVLSPATGLFFSIDAHNVYQRGPWFVFHAALCFLLVLFPMAYTAANRRRLDRRSFCMLLLFPMPTLIGGALQFLFYGTALIWSFMAISMLIIHLNIQSERMGTDYLTGAYNRRQLDSIVKDRIQASATKKTFSAILIDLDNFKRINDTFGHDAGDRALADTVALLKSCVRRGDHISRYGGDEFVMVLDIDRADVLEETVGRIKERFSQFNRSSGKPYSLSFSTGYAVYEMSLGMDPEQFIRHIDRLMYEDKKVKNGA